jgi:hypothetical protein
MNEEINSWLNSGRDYNQGLVLYEKYGISSNLKRILRKAGFSKKNLVTLVYELGKLSKIPAPRITSARPKPVEIHQVKEVTPADQRVVFVPRLEYSGLRPNTPEVDMLVQHVKNLQKVGSSMHSTLEYLPSNEQRAESAKKIREIYDEVDDIYNRLRIYDKTGSLPPPNAKKVKREKKQASQMDVQELMQRQATLRSLISKAKKREKSGVKLETRAKNVQIINLYKLELSQITERLRK